MVNDKTQHVSNVKLKAKEKMLKLEKEIADMKRIEQSMEVLEKSLTQSVETFDFPDEDEAFLMNEAEKIEMQVKIKDEKEEEEKAAKRAKLDDDI